MMKLTDGEQLIVGLLIAFIAVGAGCFYRLANVVHYRIQEFEAVQDRDQRALLNDCRRAVDLLEIAVDERTQAIIIESGTGNLIPLYKPDEELVP